MTFSSACRAAPAAVTIVMAQGQVKKPSSQLAKANKKPQNTKLGKGGISTLNTACVSVF